MYSTLFYANLETHAVSLPQLLEEEHFIDLPDDWHVVIADIQNSSAAVRKGLHSDVNLVAAGSLIAGLNIAREAGLEVPFFFGGDGGTLLVPEKILSGVLAALQRHNLNSQQNFGFTLHVGAVPIAAIRKAGHAIRVAKIRLESGLSKAVLIGDGLLWAEQQVKNNSSITPDFLDTLVLNMDGLECRWDRIKPPHDHFQVVCYIIESCNPAEQTSLYRDVLVEADMIFGMPEMRNPLSLEKLNLLVNMRKVRKEMLARFGKLKRSYLAMEFFKTAIGKFLFRYGLKFAGMDGKRYLEEVISNAETLTLDGRINTIISGTADQHTRFQTFLNKLEKAEKLCYGHHVDNESVMTCYIESREEKHIHFVDGGDGGYTAAAGELKDKMCAA